MKTYYMDSWKIFTFFKKIDEKYPNQSYFFHFFYDIFHLRFKKSEFQKLHGIFIVSLFYHLKGKKIFAAFNSRISRVKNIIVDGKLFVGLNNAGFLGCTQKTLILNKGIIEIKGNVSIGSGCRIEVGTKATVVLDNCTLNSESDFIIHNGLKIGKGSNISWGCQFLDEDFHEIVDGKKRDQKEIVIGQHVWIGNDVQIMKGVHISDGSVIAAHSIVIESFDEKNLLIGGFPAKIIKKNVVWR